ncbi:SCO family protein [Altericroceibacterium endophyticum]|uniref:Redoxin domain-containing protein n=1 Tax=Altericroceibacterium endophyticum TaxID=1808508 RepID=A0A6I4T2Z9_9SPHN|nr:redoxin domain-containing protein [Altericroceibacterium endophyticum]
MTGTAIGGNFELTDHFGKPVTQANYEGRFALIFFGFTHCKLVCPRALTRISEALELLERQAEHIQPLYVTVDPERDTPQVMRAFLEERWPRFIGLTGGRDEIEAMRSAFKVFATKVADPDNPDGYDMPHSSLTYLMDPHFRYRAHYPDTMEASQLTEELRRQLTQFPDGSE